MLQMFRKIILKQQFEPGILGVFINPFYLTRKALLNNIKKISKEITGKTLDVGCGTKPYERYFNSTEYIGLEVENTINKEEKSVDIFYKGDKIPFSDNEFDSVITSQVLEHVFNPQQFLAEINRVLKSNGKLLLTVPFIWDEHEQPFDYGRYSSFGLKDILEKNGFKIIKHIKSLNNISAVFQLFNAYVYKISVKYNLLRQILTLLIMTPSNILAIIFTLILPKNDDIFLDNVVLAEKVKDV
ncbi:MAG: methylase [Ignavibacteriales bacterium CG12_big_fil_rev_8_21_14_0_65_30_8]|nr:MAG: methylase [Ignavibacteriales bacterium CG12_big_fil_rev_8_21_14_0_65_30_8]